MPARGDCESLELLRTIQELPDCFELNSTACAAEPSCDFAYGMCFSDPSYRAELLFRSPGGEFGQAMSAASDACEGHASNQTACEAAPAVNFSPEKLAAALAYQPARSPGTASSLRPLAAAVVAALTLLLLL